MGCMLCLSMREREIERERERERERKRKREKKLEEVPVGRNVLALFYLLT